MSARRAQSTSGFTLLEMLAVVLIMGLVASLVIPGVGARSSRQLRDQANHLANDLEFARQRTVMTAVPHRLLLDLDGAAYRVEWLVNDAESTGEPPPAPDLDAELSGQKKIDLTPPRGSERSFRPLPTQLGRTVVLADGIEFAGVETDQGPVEQGAVAITFSRDGTVDPTTVMLMDSSGHRVALELAPLDEAVLVRDAT
jgi:prepilin-type N-terminal cleavage/methylation domain-containing protein